MGQTSDETWIRVNMDPGIRYRYPESTIFPDPAAGKILSELCESSEINKKQKKH